MSMLSDMNGYALQPPLLKSLLSGTGLNAGTSFPDLGGYVWTRTNSVSTVSTFPGAINSSYIFIDGTVSSKLSTPQNGDFKVNTPFTWECFVRIGVLNVAEVANLDGQAAVHLAHRFLNYSAAGFPSFILVKASAPTTDYWIATSTTALQLAVWAHYAVSLDEYWMMRQFINGKLSASAQASSNISAPNLSGSLILGQYYTGTNRATVYLQDIAYSYGCKYYADFTPPTLPLQYTPKVV